MDAQTLTGSWVKHRNPNPWPIVVSIIISIQKLLVVAVCVSAVVLAMNLAAYCIGSVHESGSASLCVCGILHWDKALHAGMPTTPTNLAVHACTQV